jgi:hypothetical protein
MADPKQDYPKLVEADEPAAVKTNELAAPPAPPPEPAPPPSDATDLADLWLDSSLGDGLTNPRLTTVPTGKPKSFFRVIADPTYRRLTEVYVHKVDGQIEEQTYLVDGPMRGVIDEARRATLVTCVFRDGSVQLWALKQPNEGEKDNEAWISARDAARTAMDRWVRLVWKRRSYMTRDAEKGYAPDPDLSKIPPFDELVRLAFGEAGIIRDRNHPIYRDLFGVAPQSGGEDDDDLS